MNKTLNMHPMILFWLGVLTGALILGVVFLERMMNLMEYQSAIYKYAPKIQQQQLDKGLTVPKLDKKGSELQKLTPDLYGETNPQPSP